MTRKHFKALADDISKDLQWLEGEEKQNVVKFVKNTIVPFLRS